jgi:hypothetical protein
MYDIDICPACGDGTLLKINGDIDSEGQQISPDVFDCSTCGFYFSEDIRYPMDQMAEVWRKSYAFQRNIAYKKWQDSIDEFWETFFKESGIDKLFNRIILIMRKARRMF